MARLRKYVYIVATTGIKYEETRLNVLQSLMARITRQCHLLHGDAEQFKKSVWKFFNNTGKTDSLPFIYVANEIVNTTCDVPAEGDSRLDIAETDRMNFLMEIILHFLRIVSQYAPLLLVIVKHQFMSKDDWYITHMICKKIRSGDLLNVSVLLSGWPQDSKCFSNRFSHRDAAVSYHTLREEFKPMLIELPRWSKYQTELFLKQEFDIQKCSPLLVKFIHNKTGGIPAMVKELVRDQNLIFDKY